MKQFTVNKLAKISGVSVRTLHHYDQIDLLKPQIRTEGNYRLYGEKELMRLQQILFYKEVGLPLKEIQHILDSPGFDPVTSLTSHKQELLQRKKQLEQLLSTIDKTILHLKKENEMKNPEELYEGFDKKQAQAYRKEAIEKYGKETVLHSEQELMNLGKKGVEQLKTEFNATWQTLFELREEDPESIKVQALIAIHYELTRKFWGTDKNKDSQAEVYKGLGEMYGHDERFVTFEGKPYPDFATFMSKAMSYFVKTKFNK